MAVRRIVPLEVGYGANIDRLGDAVRDIEEKRRGFDTEQTKVVNSTIRSFKFRTTLPQIGSKNNKPSAGADSK